MRNDTYVIRTEAGMYLDESGQEWYDPNHAADFTTYQDARLFARAHGGRLYIGGKRQAVKNYLYKEMRR
jgi:hypothetical protein